MRFIFIILVYILSLKAKSYEFDELSRILENSNFELISSRIKTQISEEELALAYSSFYPKISLNSSLYKINRNKISFNEYLKYQSQIAVGLNYNFYHFNTDVYNLEAAKYNLKANQFLECEILNKAKFELLNLYYEILNTRLKQAYYQRLQELNTEIYDFQYRLYKADESPKIELVNLALKIAKNGQTLLQIYKAEKSILTKMSNLLGINLLKTDEFKDLQIKNTEFNYNFDFEKTSKSKMILAQISQKVAKIKNLKAERLPSFNLLINYGFYKNDDYFKTSFKNMKKDDFRVGIHLKYDLFDGFSSKHKINIAQLELKLAQLEYDNAKREFDNQIKELVFNIKNINSELQSSNEALVNNKNLLSMKNRLRDNSQIDLINIKQEEINLENSILDLKILNLKQAMLVKQEELILKGLINCIVP